MSISGKLTLCLCPSIASWRIVNTGQKETVQKLTGAVCLGISYRGEGRRRQIICAIDNEHLPWNERVDEGSDGTTRLAVRDADALCNSRGRRCQVE